jgi:proliferating cell nuclear antigen PCNA
MKEGRIFEYTIEHIPVFKHLFEILSVVLHELEMVHIKPDKPVDAEIESDNEKSSDSESESGSGSGSGSASSESEAESESKKKQIVKKKEVEKGGIKIVEINDYETIIIHIRLHAQNFFKFDCKKQTYSIGMDPSNMFELLKNIDQSGQMTVYVNESNKQILNVDLQNDEKRSRSFHDFKLLDLNERKITPLPPEFDIIVEMKTEDFHNMCKELAAVGQFMIVECTEKKIEFKCRGNIRNTRKEFEHDDNRENGTVSITVNKNRANKNEPVIVREIYDLNDIIMFNKCKSLCTDIQILLRNEYIMFIRYEVASYGMMTVGFNPANEKLVNKHGNYDGKFNAFYGKNTAFEMKYKS